MFGRKKDYFITKKSIHTVEEIMQQPSTWLKTYQIINDNLQIIEKFMSNFDEKTNILLCGAGTSEFVGNTLVPHIKGTVDSIVESISTTDIVSNPKSYLKKDEKTLMISFGRSGSSPESIGAVNLANEICDEVYHLIITCNKDGVLAREAKDSDKYLCLILPDETHDQSFAMTSSFSNMLLAAYLTFKSFNLKEEKQLIEETVEKVSEFLEHDYTLITDVIDKFDFKKIVYLGSGGLKGIAQESSLKMLELTAGNICTMFDSPLGFRHGPKSIISNDVLTVVFVSGNTYTRKYDLDLIDEVLQERELNKVLLVNNFDANYEEAADFSIHFGTHYINNDFYNSLMSIVIGQLLAVFKADQLNISCDNPCPTGEVNRVVKGVTLYNLVN